MHGDCLFFDQVTGGRVERCYEGDLSCYAACSCLGGYRLSSYCEATDDEVKALITLRDQVVAGVMGYVELQDNSEQAVKNWVNAVVSVSDIPHELSDNSVESLLQLSTHILSTVAREGYDPSSTLTNFLDGIDSISSAVGTSNSVTVGAKNRRKLTTLSSQSILSSLTNYSQLLLQGMVPGQTAAQKMKSNFRLHLRPGDTPSTGCGSNTSIAMPLTSTEKSLGVHPATVSLPSSCQPAVAISLSSSLYSSSLISNSITLLLPAPPCSSSTSAVCKSLISMASDNQGAALVLASINRTVECSLNDFTNHTVACPNGKNYSVSCRGLKETHIFRCPAKSNQPTCSSLDSSLTCSLVSSGPKEITCSCELPSSSSSTPLVVSYGALLTSVETSFTTTILSAGDLNASTLKNSWQALVTISAMISAMAIALYFSYFADKAAKTKISTEDKMVTHARLHSLIYQNKRITLTQHKLLVPRGRHASANPSGATTVTANEQESEEELLFQMTSGALPQILNDRPLSSKIWEEEKKFHKYLGIVYHFSIYFARILRVVSLSTNVLIMLFVQSLTYNFTHGDDGTCASMKSESTCLAPRSYYGTGGPRCSWTPPSSSLSARTASGSCEYINPENSIEVIVFVAIFSSLVSTPLAIIVDYLVNYVLSAPDQPNRVEAVAVSSHIKPNSALLQSSSAPGLNGNEQQMLKIVPVAPARLLRHDTSENKSERDVRGSLRSMNRLSSLLGEFRTSLLGKSKKELGRQYDKAIEADFEKLLQELLVYRARIEDAGQKAELDSKDLLLSIYLYLDLNILLSCPSGRSLVPG